MKVFILPFVVELLTGSALASPLSTAPPATCPTTLVVFPHFTEGPTSTYFPSTITSTSSVDCGGCDDLVISTKFLGVGPVVHFTTTVTAEQPSTTTAFVCSPTAETD